MKKIQIAILAGIMSVALQARASFYDITFSGTDNYAANGRIDVVGGVAVSGSLTVTAGTDLGTYSLVPGVGSVRFLEGTDLIYDSHVNPGANPFLTDQGLLFALNNSVGFNLWGNGPGNYSLFDVSANVITGAREV